MNEQGNPANSGSKFFGVLFWGAVLAGVVWFASTRGSKGDQMNHRLTEWTNANPQAVRVQASQPTGSGSPGAVYVQGYYRSDGTYVAPHYRTSADGDPSNNWSSRPNVNPYTGKAGTRRP